MNLYQITWNTNDLKLKNSNVNEIKIFLEKFSEIKFLNGSKIIILTNQKLDDILFNLKRHFFIESFKVRKFV